MTASYATIHRGRRYCAKYTLPVAAVNWRKQKELGRSARVWVARHGRKDEAYRFDVLGVLVNGTSVRVRHVEGAFMLAITYLTQDAFCSHLRRVE